jgi:dienelactone hydrolase
MKHFLLALLLCLGSATVFAQSSDVFYTEGTTKLMGYLAKAKSPAGKKPGIVIIHAWMGITDHERKTADDLAALGYNALAADIYGEGVKPKDGKEAGALAGKYKGDRKLYRARIKAAIDELVKTGADPDKIAVMGYCFGGTGALEAARAELPVKGVISIHGGLDRDTTLKNAPIVAKVLVLHGADDPYVKGQVDWFQQEMRAAKADWQMVYYANAVHAFSDPAAGNDNSKGAAYNEKAARRSWEHLKVFLAELFAK